MNTKILFAFVFLMLISCSEKNNDMIGETSEAEGGCPFGFDKLAATPDESPQNDGTTAKDFWPNNLDLDVLRQNSGNSDPLGDSFNYREEFSKIDYFELKKDIEKVMTDSQEW